MAIIGSDGLLGSDLIQFLHTNFLVTAINRKSYKLHKNQSFDIVINANGNSKRFWANQNPLNDFNKSTISVYKSIFDFHCDIYIYISSSDVYENHTRPISTNEGRKINPENLQPYGLNKYLSELIVKKYTKKFLILRSSMILGTNLKKGPIYDILHNYPLFVTLQTKLQLITSSAITEIIKVLLQKNITNEIINIGGIGTFSFIKLHKYFDKKIEILPTAEKQLYEMNVKKLKILYPDLKTSEQYLQEYLKFTLNLTP